MTWDLDPVLATVFGRDVYWYGVMLACGVVHGGWYMMRLLEADKQTFFLRLASVGTICALVFARLGDPIQYKMGRRQINPNYQVIARLEALVSAIFRDRIAARFCRFYVRGPRE